MPHAYGYGSMPPPGPYGQQGAYSHQGYYDSFGNWVPYTAADYAQWGHGGAAAGAGLYGAAAAAQPGAKDDQSAAARGKGFAAKMGDRAQVKSSFTLEQRKARIGKGFVEGQGDEYGAEILVGGGGLVRRPLSVATVLPLHMLAHPMEIKLSFVVGVTAVIHAPRPG